MRNSLDYSAIGCYIVNMNRLINDIILSDLKKKMVIIVGPRQVGKTFLAKQIAKFYKSPVYLNFDNIYDKDIIQKQTWLDTTDLLILDEIHKMPNWKNFLKGVYDTKPENMHLLVTGSARLDTFRQVGDSMAGRFYSHRLLPFSLSELKIVSQSGGNINSLMTNGGFPEPYLGDNDVDVRRWRTQYIDGLIRTDILDFERIHDFKSISLLLELLRHRVGSPLSYQNISNDLRISPNTVKKYIQILEALFIIFRVTPFSTNIARSILKEPKIYFFDNGLVEGDDGARFENFSALSLLKQTFEEVDQLGYTSRLHYLRTKEGKEVDFAVVRDGKIENIIEVKLSDTQIDKNLYYFRNRYDLKAIQLVKNIRLEREEGGIKVLRAEKYLSELVVG